MNYSTTGLSPNTDSCSLDTKDAGGCGEGFKVAELDAARESHTGEADHILFGQSFKDEFVEYEAVTVEQKECEVVDLGDAERAFKLKECTVGLLLHNSFIYLY